MPDRQPPLSLTAQLGQRLRQARLAKGLSIAELGRLTALDQDLLERIEGGLTRPAAADLVELAMALDIRLSALFH